MGNAVSAHSLKEVLQYDNLSDEDKEELGMIDSYTNQMKLNNFTKEQVKIKIQTYISIHNKPNRHFTLLKNFYTSLN
jgi:hypothetical protein